MTNFNEFIDYVLSFYGKDGLYPQNRTKEQVAFATCQYLDAVTYYESEGIEGYTWGYGDSLDRERVRDIMNNYYGEN